MKTYTILLLLILFNSLLNAQIILTDQQIKEKTDSILIEGNLLFRYEIAAWITTDLALEKENIKSDFGGYLVYQANDTIKTIILNKDSLCVFESSYIHYANIPSNTSFTLRNLTEIENRLLKIKTKIINEIVEKEYDVVCPQGFNLNLILIPFGKGYKLYYLTGTSQSKVIPFGNDYLFISDETGTILTWKKFHSRLLSVPTTTPNGELVKQTTHSHLNKEPFISATDICTFILYGELCGQTNFSVYSPALSKWFKYKLIENEIEITDN